MADNNIINFRSPKIIIAILLFCLIPIWLYLVAPYLKKLPNNFYYRADILSLDNFYNEKLSKYEGEQISKTIFNYQVVDVKPSGLIIQNRFEVSKISGEAIFSVERLYGINPFTWRHQLDLGDEQRTGYLFGPRYANHDDFIYWHINYNAPAPMKFVAQEYINGLRVYHYAAHYVADQTKNLEHLPDVPSKRGIRADIILNIWIEPISGWLIKYKDNTVAYYYDRHTQRNLIPWNKFSNQYTQTSVVEQINNAWHWKWRILIIDFGVPMCVTITALILMFISYLRKP